MTGHAQRKRLRWAAIAVALLVLSPIVFLAALSAMSRKPTNLGVRDGHLAPCPASPNCVSTQAEDPPHRMAPLPLGELSAAEALDRIKRAIAGTPRMKIVAETDTYLRAEATSLIFRFVDDVEFFIDADARLIHFRSASRVGRSDFGVNRSRMEKLCQALNSEPGA